MPRESKIAKLARQRGMTEIDLVKQAADNAGSLDDMATLLESYPYSIRSWLARRGLRVEAEKRMRITKVDDHD